MTSQIKVMMHGSVLQCQGVLGGGRLPGPANFGFLCSPSRQYYEMMYNTADELLNLVVDQGVKYTELEYIYALSLLHRSQTGVGDQTTQNMRLQRLKEIICEQAAIKQATKDKKITTV